VSDWPNFDGIRVQQRLASEGVTETYAAVQEDLGRKVIVKALSPSVLPSSPFASALRREAQILGELCHPYVQRLYDFRCTESQMWLVLEHFDGASLAEVLAKLGPLPPLAVASLGFMVASGLAHCHSRGTIHRALEPRCVALSRSGTATLVGFVGAVKDRLPTAPELLDGSPHLAVSPYFSPEQVLGESVDARSDIFSLGVLLYEALTGKNPFADPDDRSVAQRIRKDKVPPVSRFVRAVPSALERTLHRCLEKMPQDRFSSAKELVTAFESLLREHDVVSPEGDLEKALLSHFDKSTSRAAPSHLSTAVGSSRREMSPLAAGLLGLSLGSALIAFGGYLFQLRQAPETTQPRRSTGRLELAPEHAASLRIVANPWATITIDGQEIGTTPIGRAIALSAGTHYVQLEHPRASVERRVIHLSAGETVLLDVKMNVAPSASTSPLPNTSPDASASP
jgi:serine/threonine-protein kinase